LPQTARHVVAKHGLIGLIRTMAREFGPHRVRVNTVLPGYTNTPMVHYPGLRARPEPDAIEPRDEQFRKRAQARLPLGIPWVEATGIIGSFLRLCPSAARYVTGVAPPIDGGSTVP
jgi:NAD(P)-dependent dehydrogenase (short-subunit alcohol dehydrogenase family)